MLADFYGPFSTIAFTVFGLWMFVVQSRFREWIGNRDQYRRASAVSVQLALPGIMSLLALIDTESETLWQWAFGLTSALAIGILLALARRTAGTPRGANEVANGVAILLFVCIAVVSIWPDIVRELGLEAAPARGVEFFFFCLLLLNALVTAWLMLFAETPPARPRGGEPPAS